MSCAVIHSVQGRGSTFGGVRYDCWQHGRRERAYRFASQPTSVSTTASATTTYWAVYKLIRFLVEMLFLGGYTIADVLLPN